MKTLSLKLPDFLESRLVEFARERKTTKSEIAREALMEYLSRERKVIRGSFLELAGEIAGSVES